MILERKKEMPPIHKKNNIIHPEYIHIPAYPECFIWLELFFAHFILFSLETPTSSDLWFNNEYAPPHFLQSTISRLLEDSRLILYDEFSTKEHHHSGYIIPVSSSLRFLG